MRSSSDSTLNSTGQIVSSTKIRRAMNQYFRPCLSYPKQSCKGKRNNSNNFTIKNYENILVDIRLRNVPSRFCNLLLLYRIPRCKRDNANLLREHNPREHTGDGRRPGKFHNKVHLQLCDKLGNGHRGLSFLSKEIKEKFQKKVIQTF